MRERGREREGETKGMEVRRWQGRNEGRKEESRGAGSQGRLLGRKGDVHYLHYRTVDDLLMQL